MLHCCCRQQNKVLLYSIIPHKVVSELAKGLGYARVRQATILFAVRQPAKQHGCAKCSQHSTKACLPCRTW
jgi:hypothetical protein